MKALATIVVAVCGMTVADAAAASPAAYLASEGTFTLVRDGCGFGAHQGRFGGCRLNHGWRGRMRGMMGAAPLGCPPGTHPVGRGFCRSD